MGCYLEDYWARVGIWAARTAWRAPQGNVQVMFCLGSMILCATTLAMLLVIGGVEKIPGPGVKAEKFRKFCAAGATEI
jgi:hypothetical protein